MEIENKVRDFFSKAVKEYGATPKGVVWNSNKRIHTSFHQLTKIIDFSLPHFSLNDLGCGYGELVKFLKTGGEVAPAFKYYGVDMSSDMITCAQKYCKDDPECTFTISNTLEKPCDYSIANGIFNMKLDAEESAWIDYVKSSLCALNNYSSRGFSFNALTSYSDKDKMKPELFYANPGEFFDFCKKNFSQNVALLHDYGHWEFTILVRK
jgi:SAM-dependent methyltransferase